jgi:hypothetical protein
VQHGFQIKEYELFHDVLHPLQHEALPQEDFQRIRSMANELVTRGRAIVKLGVPEARRANRLEFAKTLRKFDGALASFKSDARARNDIRLRKSYIAVHDLFEKLAELVPSVYPMGDPPIASIECPSNKVAPGEEVTLSALTDGLDFRWTVGAAKILSGQGTRTVTIDTTGLAGQTVMVSVEVNYGNGFVSIATCVVKISASK